MKKTIKLASIALILGAALTSCATISENTSTSKVDESAESAPVESQPVESESTPEPTKSESTPVESESKPAEESSTTEEVKVEYVDVELTINLPTEIPSGKGLEISYNQDGTKSGVDWTKVTNTSDGVTVNGKTVTLTMKVDKTATQVEIYVGLTPWSSDGELFKDTYTITDGKVTLGTPVVDPVVTEYSVKIYDGSTLVTTLTTKSGDSVTYSQPTKDEYTSDGIYTDSAFKNKYNGEAITGDTDLYLKYTVITYTVTFKNGDTVVSSEKYKKGDTIVYPSNPTKIGYTFKSWDSTATTCSGEMTINAVFEIENYTITFIADGTTYTTETANYNETVNEPKNPTKDGYTFQGWYTDSEFNTKYDFNSKVTNKFTLYAKFTKDSTTPTTSEIKVIEAKGFNEGAYITFNYVDNLKTYSSYTVEYKLKANSTYTELIDTTNNKAKSNLLRDTGSNMRLDLVGLKAGTYEIKITCNTASVTKEVVVTAEDRSGYAHFNYSSGIGAYNDDGTLKSNAVVLYVTNETKNTITYGGKTGLVAILQNQSKYSSTPLCIRVLDSIKTNQWKVKETAPRLTDNTNLQLDTYWVNELETTYGENLVGIRVKLMDKYLLKSYNWTQTKTGLSSMTEGSTGSKTTTYTQTKYSDITGKTVYDDDSYNNMLDVSEAQNVTLEGIGSDAEFFQWGLTWSNCNSIEVKNITFTDYPEDACSFGGTVTKHGNIWVHGNTFNKGKNNWDVAGERDKPAGDGAFDLSSVHNVTLSYNQFNSCKKTGLVGGSDSMLNMNITFHHNYYNQVGSRLPLGRQANMHIYNNYYYKCGTAQDIRANAFVLSESNYFTGVTNPQKISSNAVIKSYNDVLTSCGSSAATVVTDRTKSLTSSCKPDGSTDYSNFDTNSSLFYYDSTNKKSNVSILTAVNDVPTFVPTVAGAGKYASFSLYGDDEPTTPVDPTPTTGSWETKLNETFTSGTLTKTSDIKNETNAGIYYKNWDNSDLNDSNKATINNGLTIVDESSSTTSVFYKLANTYNTGKVRYTFNVSFTSIGSKWSVITLSDGSKSLTLRMCGTNSSDGKKYGYSLDGGSTEVVGSTTLWQANTTYTIIVTIDYDTKTAVISINGTEFTISDFSLNAITNVEFRSSSTGRTFTINSFKIEAYKEN